MSVNKALENILEGNLDAMRTHLSNTLATKAVEKLEERKIDIAQGYFGQVMEEEQIDEGTVQKQKSDFRSPKYKYRQDAPHMGKYKMTAGTYMTGPGSYDDKDETKVSHGKGRKMTKRLRSASSEDERSKLWNKFWTTGSMDESANQLDEIADTAKGKEAVRQAVHRADATVVNSAINPSRKKKDKREFKNAMKTIDRGVAVHKKKGGVLDSYLKRAYGIKD